MSVNVQAVMLTGLRVGETGFDELQPMSKALLVGMLLQRSRGLTQEDSKRWAWADSTEASPPLVAKKVSALRAAGCSVRSARGGGSYRLEDLDFDAVDAHRFVAEYRRGRELVVTDPAAAVEAWEEALRLWTPYVPLADRHSYVQCPSVFEKYETSYRDLVADLCDAVLRQPGDDARGRAVELLDLLVEAAPEDGRLPRLREAAGAPTPFPVQARRVPPAGAAPYGAAEEQYVAEYARRCAMVDPRHIQRSRPMQDVIVPLDDVYIALTLDAPDPAPQGWGEGADESPSDLESDHHRAPDLAGPDGRAVLALGATGMSDEVPTPGDAAEPGLTDTAALRPAAAPVELVELIREKRWAVVLGDPGAGKSTLLQWLALNHAKALAADQERVLIPGHQLGLDVPEVDLGPARLPVLARVADYAEFLRREADQAPGKAIRLLDFLGLHHVLDEPLGGSSEEERAALIRARLNAGRAIVLLDGLDEITDRDLRLRVRRDIETFVADHIVDPQNPGALHPWADSGTGEWWRVHQSAPADSGGNQIVVTSRVNGYRETALDSRYTLVRVQPLTPKMIERFCGNWCLAVQRFRALTTHAPDEEIRRLAAKDAAKLNDSIRARPGVARIASNPLLLTVLATLLKGGQLPAHRTGVYEQACRALVERRQLAWSLQDVIRALGPLALWLHENRSNGVATLEEVRYWLTESLPRVVDGTGDLSTHVDEFLAAREASGLLVEVSEGRFRFLHLTFQEFLAACELTRSLSEFRSHLERRLHDHRWFDVSAMSMALVCQNRPDEIDGVLAGVLDAGSAHEDIVHRDLLFTAYCLIEMPCSLPAPTRRVVDELLAAGMEAQARGYPQLTGRIRELLRSLHEAWPRLLLPRLVGALHDPVTAAFATDVCSLLEVSSQTLPEPVALLEGVDAACRRWDRSPRAVAIRADITVRLRAVGHFVDARFLPIETLLDEYADATDLLSPCAPQVTALLRRMARRVDPAVQPVLRWFLDGVRGQAPQAPTDAVDRLVDALLEECRSAQGADFAALAAVAYDLAPQRAKDWVSEEFRSERVDLLSAARLLVDLVAFFPDPGERDAWFAALPDTAARALLRQAVPQSRAYLMTALAWQRLRAGGSSETTAEALALLRRMAEEGRFIELTLDAIHVMRSLLRSRTERERQSALFLLRWLVLPPDPSDALTDRLEEIAVDGEDELAVLADIVLAALPDRRLTPRRYDVVADALLCNGERLRRKALSGLHLRRDATGVPAETLGRATLHEKRLAEAGDLVSAGAHAAFVQRVFNASLEWMLSVGRERVGMDVPRLSSEAAAEGLLRAGDLTDDEVSLLLTSCVWFDSATGSPLGLDPALLRSALGAVRGAARESVMALLAAEAAVLDRVPFVIESLEKAHGPELTAVAVRECAAHLHRHEGNWSAVAALRDLAQTALVEADQTNPQAAQRLTGALFLLDLVEGAAPDATLAGLAARTRGDTGLVQALVWALSGPSEAMATRSGATVHSLIPAIGAALGASARRTEALVRHAAQLLDTSSDDWRGRRAVLGLLDAAADRGPETFAACSRSVHLADRLAAGAKDRLSFSVRRLSLCLMARLDDSDPSLAVRLTAECRDIDVFRQAVSERLQQPPPPVWRVEPADTHAALTGEHFETALLAGRFAVRASRSAGSGMSTANAAELLALRVHRRDALARPLLGLLDELLVVGSRYPTSATGLERWQSESALLGEHRLFYGKRDLWYGTALDTDTVVGLVTSRLPWLESKRVTAAASFPPRSHGSDIGWTDLGFTDGLSSHEKNLLSGVIYNLAEARVGSLISRKMDRIQFRRFWELAGADDQVSARKLLDSAVPDYPEDARRVLSSVHDEVRQHATELLTLLRPAKSDKNGQMTGGRPKRNERGTRGNSTGISGS
ncbi:hypothetical protein [Streptomyces sp. HUAS ZL42]|uniref:hypothetical protein n=1 Tax=Streptomyces sp. HUAS ZL42 TaxID=3231715 RepID=UPI00345EED6D